MEMIELVVGIVVGFAARYAWDWARKEVRQTVHPLPFNPPSGVQMKRPGAKRKPIVADDRRAWEKEQEKA
jgi:hypothetical protein